MLRRLFAFLGSWLAPAPKKRGKSRRSHSMLEPLEDRVAPATLVNAHIVTYTDIDGDHVTINSSRPIFTGANYNSILTFAKSGKGQQLELINLDNAGASAAAGDNLSVTAQKVAGGDGFVNVGGIQADFSLGHVTVQGDLGNIVAGTTSSSSPVGLASLTVHTLDAENESTQAPDFTNFISTITGAVGSITVQQNIGNAEISVQGNSGTLLSNGTIGSIYIGGSIVGGTQSDYGSIITDGNVGSITIAGNLQGNSGGDSASLQIGGSIGSLTIGSIIGYTKTDAGTGSASVLTGTSAATGGIRSLVIHGDIRGGAGGGSGEIVNQATSGAGALTSASISGGIYGGSGASSGIISDGTIGSLVIGNGIHGGSGKGSAEISASTIGSLVVTNGITGSSGADSGSVVTANGISSIDILSGGIIGGTATGAGSIQAATSPTNAAVINSIIVHGNITGLSTAGASVTGTGQINTTSSIGSVTLYGSLVGSAAQGSGSIISGENITQISLLPGASSAGSIMGGSGIASGAIVTSGPIAGVHIGGGIMGGGGSGSGVITTGSSTSFGENIGSLVILGGITGGAGANSGQVNVGGLIASANLGNSAITGGSGSASGAIIATDDIRSLTLGSLIAGGEISTGGNLPYLNFTGAHAPAITDSGLVDVAGDAGTIVVHGSIAGSGSTANTGLFLIGGSVNIFSVTGALQGGSGADSGSVFAGLNGTSGIGTLVVSGGIIGGSKYQTGEVYAGSIASASVSAITGGSGPSSGGIVTTGNIGALRIAGALKGANFASNAGTVAGSGYIEAAHIGSAVIGSIQAGTVAAGDTLSADGAILASRDIASLTVTGSITGTSTNPVVISAVGQLIPGRTDFALGAIAVGGNVTYANFLAGYDQAGSPAAGGASIGSVVVAGNWSGGNLVAGVIAANGNFGDPGATLIGSTGSLIPTIASIVIRGQVQNAPVAGSADTYGFVAEKIDSFILHGVAQPLTAGILDPVGQSTDTVLRAIA